MQYNKLNACHCFAIDRIEMNYWNCSANVSEMKLMRCNYARN